MANASVPEPDLKTIAVQKQEKGEDLSSGAEKEKMAVKTETGEWKHEVPDKRPSKLTGVVCFQCDLTSCLCDAPVFISTGKCCPDVHIKSPVPWDLFYEVWGGLGGVCQLHAVDPSGGSLL